MNLLKKENLSRKIMLNEISKNLWKMVSADIKANIKQQEIKVLLVGVSTNFYRKYLQNLKYNVKRVCVFRLILVKVFHPS